MFIDLLPSDSYTPTLHLVAYSVNQKGRSEPTVLEDIAINEAEKRTGTKYFHFPYTLSSTSTTFVASAIHSCHAMAWRKKSEQKKSFFSYTPIKRKLSMFSRFLVD